MLSQEQGTKQEIYEHNDKKTHNINTSLLERYHKLGGKLVLKLVDFDRFHGESTCQYLNNYNTSLVIDHLRRCN